VVPAAGVAALQPDVAAVVTVIDTASRATVNIPLPNGSSSVRGICVSPNGKHAYAVHVLSRYQLPATQADRGWMNTNAMSIFDAPAKKLLGTVLLDNVDQGAANPWGVTTTADGKMLLVSHSGSHELSLIDTEGLIDELAKVSAMRAAAEVPNNLAFLVGLRQRIRLKGNGPRGLAAVGSKVYAAEFFSDTLAIVDLEPSGAKPVSQAALGPRPQPTMQRRGEMLFHDAELGFQHWQSCSTCHPDAWAAGLNWDLLNDGLGNPKNTRSLLLVQQRGPTMALGVRTSAEDAVRAGIAHVLFAVRPEEDVVAIDAYLKSLEPIPSPYLVDGKLSPAAERGKTVFFGSKVDCTRCHFPPIYCDKKAHNVESLRRYDQLADTFTTACLVEVWRAAPYMHDGQYPTIKKMLVRGRHGLRRQGSLELSDAEIDDLSEFVLSL
jgi:mono/diheme cytochrome c family protein